MVNIMLYPTFKCNLKCACCMHNASPENTDEMTIEIELYAARFFKWLTENNIRVPGVCITGGEPFVHPRIYDMINAYSTLIQRSQQQIYFSLCTNGTIPVQLDKIHRNPMGFTALNAVRVSTSIYHDSEIAARGLSQDFMQFTGLVQEPSLHKVVQINDKGRAGNLISGNPSKYSGGHTLCYNSNYSLDHIAFMPKFVNFCTEDSSGTDPNKYIEYAALFKMPEAESFKYLYVKAKTWTGIKETGGCANKCRHYQIIHD